MNAFTRAARAFGDTINIGVNAATGGLFNRGIGYLMGASGEQVDQMNQGMRQRTGLGGDAAAGLGQALLVGRGLKVAGAGLNAAKALPTAVALTRTAGPAAAARYALGMPAAGVTRAAVEGGRNLLPTAAGLTRAAKGGATSAELNALARGSAGQLVPVTTTSARALMPSMRTVGKTALVAAPVAASVIGGMDSTVTPQGGSGVGPQGKYTQEELGQRAAYLDSRAKAPFAGDPNHIDLTDPVAASLAAGRGASAVVTPYERQLEALNTILASPNATLSDLQAATAMLPAAPKQGSKKDAAFGRTAELSRQIFESQIASIGAQKDAGEITEEQARAMTATAMNEEFQRQAGMQGFNPMNLMQAQMMAPDEEAE